MINIMNNFTPNENFKFFFQWVEKRMEVFWNRLESKPQPWTDDKVILNHKFTNVYRVLDRSSQYLLSNVINVKKNYNTLDMAWRILLYKHFNLPSTWEALEKEFGDITLDTPPNDLIDFFHKYSKKGVIYSNAYMVTASFMRSEPIMAKYGLVAGMPKYESYIRLYWKGFIEEGILVDILKSNSMEEGFNHFKRVVGVADFLAYQFVQDFNYVDIVDWDDNSFCAAGPGTQRGVHRAFDIEGKPDYQEIVKWVHSNFKELLKEYSCEFRSLPDHLPTVPDISNCFCEFSKYMKGVNPGTTDGNKRIKQRFHRNHNELKFIFPEKWGDISI